MEKKDQTDYAAAYRQFCTYGKGRSLKQFCEDENFNYSKLRRYIDKSFWSASKSVRESIGCQCAPMVIETESSTTNEPSVTIMENVPANLSIASIEVKLTNGLKLTVDSPSIDSLVEVLHKLVG
jgi:hypothetical protein